MTADTSIAKGRPLRFLAIVLGGWTGARVALLWPAVVPTPLPMAPLPMAPLPVAAWPANLREAPTRGVAAPTVVPRFATALPIPARTSTAIAAPVVRVAPAARPAPERGGDESRMILALAGMGQYGAAMPVEPEPVATTKRWSASTWALMRGSGGSTGVATPQLGGSQVGARIAYRLGARGRFAAVARAAAAVGTRQQEAALGVEWRPTAAPVRLVVERRFGIANIRGGFAAGAVGGVDQIPLPGDVRLDGYAQAGVIARDGGVGYADGAVRAGRRVAPMLDLGLGAWGAAQPGAARVDIGPSAVVRVPIAGKSLRLGAEWRQRVAGDARPASGPAIALGMDF